MKFRILALTVATLAFGFLSFLIPHSASAAGSGDFAAKINGLRASKGLPALSVNGSLSSFAQSWTGKMADAGKISHNPNLSSAPGNWTTVGENVGVGGSVDSIFNALVASPGHYANMVNPKYNSVGIGVVVGGDGRIYTTHNFAAYPSSGSSSNSKSSTPTTKAPVPAAAKPAASKPSNSQSSTPAASAPAATSTTSTSTAPAGSSTSTGTLSTPTAPSSTSPVPSERIVQGLVEVGNISTQG